MYEGMDDMEFYDAENHLRDLVDEMKGSNDPSYECHSYYGHFEDSD